jgi:hypothetical protein
MRAEQTSLVNQGGFFYAVPPVPPVGILLPHPFSLAELQPSAQLRRRGLLFVAK